jgi:hypothetical protein
VLVVSVSSSSRFRARFRVQRWWVTALSTDPHVGASDPSAVIPQGDYTKTNADSPHAPAYYYTRHLPHPMQPTGSMVVGVVVVVVGSARGSAFSGGGSPPYLQTRTWAHQIRLLSSLKGITPRLMLTHRTLRPIIILVTCRTPCSPQDLWWRGAEPLANPYSHA